MRSNLVSLLTLIASAGVAFAGPLTPGNLAVVRVGDGAASLGNGATAVFIDEYTTGGTLVQTIAVPTSASGGNRALTMAGSSTAMGALSMSLDGRYLTFTGFDAAVGTASVAGTTSAVVNRVVGRLDLSGAVDTTTAMNAAFSGNQPRSAVTVDGQNFWVSGGNSGVQYISYGTSNAANQVSTGNPTNLRVLNLALGNVYVSSASGTGTQGVLQLGSGLQTSPAALALAPGFATPTGGSMYDFYFASPTVAYAADDSATAGVAGLQKWELQAGTWTRTATFAAPAGTRIRHIAGSTDAGGVSTLFITGDNGSSANSAFFSFTEAGGFSSALALAGTNSAFRGIELIVPTPGAATLLGLGAVVALRRRRAR